MLDKQFPAGEKVTIPQSIFEISDCFELGEHRLDRGENPDFLKSLQQDYKYDIQSREKEAVQLISRMFTLLSFNEAGICMEEKAQLGSIDIPKLDFDISAFCSYVE